MSVLWRPMAWLLRGDDVLATAEIAATRSARRRGLLGRDAVEGVLVLERCRNVHTFGMRIPIDVMLCDRLGRVLTIRTLAPNRIAPFVRGTRTVVEASAGSCDRWSLRVGDVIEVRA